MLFPITFQIPFAVRKARKTTAPFPPGLSKALVYWNRLVHRTLSADTGMDLSFYWRCSCMASDCAWTLPLGSVSPGHLSPIYFFLYVGITISLHKRFDILGYKWKALTQTVIHLSITFETPSCTEIYCGSFCRPCRKCMMPCWPFAAWHRKQEKVVIHSHVPKLWVLQWERTSGAYLSCAANCMGDGKLDDSWGKFSVQVPSFGSLDWGGFQVSVLFPA